MSVLKIVFETELLPSERSSLEMSCFISICPSVCRFVKRQRMPNIRKLLCLVDIKKRSFLTYGYCHSDQFVQNEGCPTLRPLPFVLRMRDRL